MIGTLPKDFKWWFGVVEQKTGDPKKLGRVKVRVWGVHNTDKTHVRTEDLPWAEVIYSPGAMHTPPNEGAEVIGFFRDGDMCQRPVIWGVMHGVNSNIPQNFGKPSEQQEAFADPAQDLNRPRILPKGFDTNKENGLGSNAKTWRPGSREMLAATDNTNPKTSTAGQSSISKLAQGGVKDTIVEGKQEKRILNVISQSTDGSKVSQYKWSEPDPILVYGAEYPYNNAMETGSGHAFELDDTIGYERINLHHRSGTFDEMIANGDRIQKTLGNNYRTVFQRDHYFCFDTRHESFGGSHYSTAYENKGCIIGGDYWNFVHKNKFESIKGTNSIWSADNMLVAGKALHFTGESEGVYITGRGNGMHFKSIDANLNMQAEKSVQVLAYEDFNVHAFDTATLMTNGIMKVLGGNVTQVSAGDILQLQSSGATSITGASGVSVSGMFVGIGSTVKTSITGAIILLNCGIPSVPLPGPVPGVLVDNVKEATHPGMGGDARIPDPSTFTNEVS